MVIEPPKIDIRDYQALVDRTRELLVQYYCSEEWANISALRADKQADTLIHIFSRMMEIIIQRLNKVPDKNFLTFLDLIGLTLSPPKVARVPLTFAMAKGESRFEIVHAGTQVATTQAKEKEAAVFETEKDLTIIQPKLVGGVSLNPDNDKWKDHTPVLIDNKMEGTESLFEGKDPVPHRLYLGHNRLFSFKEKTTIELDVEVSEISNKTKDWEVKWYYFDETLSKISIDAEGIDKDENKDPRVANLLKSGTIIFKDMIGISENTLKGFKNETGPSNTWKNYWIFAELGKPIPKDQLPEISSIKAGVKIAPVSSEGTGKISTDRTKITGTGTAFTKELKAGYKIMAANETRNIEAIESDNLLSVGSPFGINFDNERFTFFSTGTGKISTSNRSVQGNTTIFSKELKKGDKITVKGQVKNITSIESDNALRVDSTFSPPLRAGTTFTYSRAGMGTIMSKGGTTEIIGVERTTQFTKELVIGDFITIKDENGNNITRMITAISSDFSLTVDQPLPEFSGEFRFTSSGTGTISSGTVVTGDESTRFTEELKIGYSISAEGQTRQVTAINSNSSLIIESAFEPELHKPDSSGFEFEFSSKCTGTISSGTVVIGNEDARFTEQLKRGSIITAEDRSKLVSTILSDTSLIVDSAIDIALDNAGFTYRSPLFPEKVFFNNFPLEITKDFYPFGEKPKFNDTFYMGSKEAFAKNGADITVMIALSDRAIPDTQNIKLVWEFWDGKSWIKIGDTSQMAVSEQGTYEFSDQTCAFKRNGKVKFNCPKIEESEINGEKNHWIRVRIIGGNYGEDATYEERMETTSTSNPLWIYKPPTYKPPSLSILTLNYEFKPAGEDFDSVLSYNDFVYQDKTKETKEGISFLPFQPVTDSQPGLYIAFDQDISTLPVTLFFPLSEITLTAINIFEFDISGPGAGATGVKLENVANLKKGDIIEFCNKKNDTEQRSITAVDENNNVIKWNPGLTADFSDPGSTIVLFPPPVLAWEYWNGKKWVLLESLVDETKNLTMRGLVQFLVPSDIQERHCFEFDAENYWIRARLISGTYETFPKLKGFYTNTVWAHNTVTMEEEVLGSSIGKPDQVFKFSQSPVIGKPEIYVQEISITDEDKKTIITSEGNDAITEIEDDAGNITGFWVRWHEVGHFFSSIPDSRHYVIEHNTGEVIFGNGERGMIPPIGKDNIKSRYQSGGGLKGNVAAGDITKLRTALPFVDSVINPEAADGGGEKEDMDRIRERGPQTLKHRDRAVTYEDYIWLVKAEFQKVAKIKCLPTMDPSMLNRPGWITLIVVPESDDPKPLPTQQLISEIQSFLFERCSTYITIRPQINLVSPGYIKVWVEAKVQYTSITEAKTIESMIIKNLNEFFHPLRGGPEKNGWDFGRNVYISEVYEVIENTDGVDYVDQLFLNASIQMYKLTLDKSFEIQVSYPEHSRVVIASDEGNIIYLLAEYLSQDTKIDTMTVMGFKEGDSITLIHKNDGKSVNLKVKSVYSEKLGDILQCESFTMDKEFPKGSIVKSRDGVESIILNDVHIGDISLNPIKVAILKDGDNGVLSLRDYPATGEKFVIQEASSHVETIFVEDNYLIYSGTHSIYSGAEEIKKEKEMLFRYLININSGEFHDLQNEHRNCRIKTILEKNKKFVRTLQEIDKYDYCRWCFGPELSKR